MQSGIRKKLYHADSGFSLVEVMVSLTVIALVSLSTIQATIQSLRIFDQGSAREGIEQAISNDLGWLRAFSKSWHCQVGSYEGCLIKSQGIASAINYRPFNYSEDPTTPFGRFKLLCTNRDLVKVGFTPSSSSDWFPAFELLNKASQITGSYSPPNVVPWPAEMTETVLDLSEAPRASQNYTVYRTLKTIPTNSYEESFLNGNSIVVRYFTKASDTPYIRIQRQEQLFVEATAWCP